MSQWATLGFGGDDDGREGDDASLGGSSFDRDSSEPSASADDQDTSGVDGASISATSGRPAGRSYPRAAAHLRLMGAGARGMDAAAQAALDQLVRHWLCALADSGRRDAAHARVVGHNIVRESTDVHSEPPVPYFQFNPYRPQRGMGFPSTAMWDKVLAEAAVPLAAIDAQAGLAPSRHSVAQTAAHLLRGPPQPGSAVAAQDARCNALLDDPVEFERVFGIAP